MYMYTFCERMLVVIILKWLKVSHFEHDLHQKLIICRIGVSAVHSANIHKLVFEISCLQ